MARSVLGAGKRCADMVKRVGPSANMSKVILDWIMRFSNMKGKGCLIPVMRERRLVTRGATSGLI